jgi:hypothetical protein
LALSLPGQGPVHRPDAGADLHELGLEVALDRPGHGHHALAGPSPEVLEGPTLVFGKPSDGGAVRPGQVRHGLALPLAELADQRPEPPDLRARPSVGPSVPRPRDQGPEDLLDPLEPEAQGLEAFLGVGHQRPADVPGVGNLWRRSGTGLGHGGPRGPGYRLLDPKEPLVDAFLEGPLVGVQDLLKADLPCSLAWGGLGDGDGVREALPGRAPPRPVGDRRRWWL